MLKKLKKTFRNSKKSLLLPVILLILNTIFFILISTVKFSSFDVSASIIEIDKEKTIENYLHYRIETQVDNTINQMDMDEKIGQLFMLSISGYTLNDNTQSLVEDYQLGSIVLMSGNISTQEQVKDFIKSIRDTAQIKVLISTDQEGGIVARIPWDDARYISQPHLGIVNREDFAYEAGTDHAKALYDLNIDVNLAPVLDVSFISNSAMSSRTLGADSTKVSQLGVSIIKAHQDTGIIAVAKHYPGIGRSTTNSHLSVPVIDVSKEQFESEELLPFKTAVEEGVDMIMTGHAIYPQIDDKFPASLSTILITDILRDDLGFDGIVLSDDISMGALNDYPDKVIDAFLAGNDMILIVDSYENQVTFITQLKEAVEKGTISDERVNESVRRVLRLKYKYGE